jgi:hypothetical protein
MDTLVAGHQTYGGSVSESHNLLATPKTRRPRMTAEPIKTAPHPLLNLAQEVAAGLIREDRRVHLSDELHPDIVGELLLARLEHQDPIARAAAWLRTERSWRHHLAPLLEVG